MRHLTFRHILNPGSKSVKNSAMRIPLNTVMPRRLTKPTGTPHGGACTLEF